MEKYYFKNNEFVIEDYDKQKTFSSFLPGLAGKSGIPLWAFYVNRGQGIASFGVQDKNSQILEFNPAVTAYEVTPLNGFRSFIKKNGNVYEVFGNDSNATRKMKIKRSEFSVVEENNALGIDYEVSYFGLPNENIAGLVREVTITNTTDEVQQFELVDGLSQLFPYQVANSGYKSVGNLLRSWMEVYGLEENIGYYRMRSSSADTAEVAEVTQGNFYISSYQGELIKPIVDSRLIFDYDNSKQRARYFETHSVQEIQQEEQVTANKVPVGFTAVEVVLKPKQSHKLYTVIGHVHSEEALLERATTLVSEAYITKKRQEAYDEIEHILQEVDMQSAFPIFDDYIKQNYLDNILRGGYPLVINSGNNNFVYHLFSRRHGDLERDYNFFSLAPEFYSQGNGSFRDVCQNRRNDVFLNPEIEDFDMKMFASFIQADGYNPLSIDGSSFEIENKDIVKKLVEELFGGSPIMMNLLMGKFTPGALINTMYNNKITVELDDMDLFKKVFEYAKQNYEAHFAEGYWIDHWTYILDLVENYEAVYPDRIKQKLFGENDYRYFDSPIYVLPRDEKICLTKDGKVRRYGSILHDDHEKVEKLQMNPYAANWLRCENNHHLTTNLYGKLFVLALNKISNIDPSGMGIEMEANKPGWNDAMNGLPGLFGSGVSEMIELKRVVDYLLKHYDLHQSIMAPVEFIGFVMQMNELFKQDVSDFEFWNLINDIKEHYREEIRFTSVGSGTLGPQSVKLTLDLLKAKIEKSLEKSLAFGDGIYPTYLVHEVTKYVELKENNGPKIGHYGLPTVKPLAFSVRALPYYLEAPARAMKTVEDATIKKHMFEKIKESNIYDHELKFYKTSEFLDDESNEIGRGRSFTKGWQERESNFLHMTYKYLLGMLKGGMYDEFYREIDTNLTCFMDPAVYGRSTLENSSFIASSINPDPHVRGQGFVARLSGSTAEMLSIWIIMCAGKKPFSMKNNKLTLTLEPKLHKSFFKDNKVSFMFLGKVKVTYINTKNINTFDKDFAITKYVVDGKEVPEISGVLAEKVREGLVHEIHVYA